MEVAYDLLLDLVPNCTSSLTLDHPSLGSLCSSFVRSPKCTAVFLVLGISDWQEHHTPSACLPSPDVHPKCKSPRNSLEHPVCAGSTCTELPYTLPYTSYKVSYLFNMEWLVQCLSHLSDVTTYILFNDRPMVPTDRSGLVQRRNLTYK